jgi:anhydro-N-acetylmuramic acid kinase
MVNKALLEELGRYSYFEEKPPKSTGREQFGREFISDLYQKVIRSGISMEDAIATVTDFTAWSIEDSYNKFILPVYTADQLIVGGGGSYNTFLISRIRKRMEQYGVSVLIQEDLGFNSDAKEAAAFAILADCTMAGKCNNVPSVTGAGMPVVMGKISL